MDYDTLKDDYARIKAEYGDLSKEHERLKSDHRSLIDENEDLWSKLTLIRQDLETMRILMHIFIITTVAFAVAAILVAIFVRRSITRSHAPEESVENSKTLTSSKKTRRRI